MLNNRMLAFIDVLSPLIKYSHENVMLNADQVATANKIFTVY